MKLTYTKTTQPNGFIVLETFCNDVSQHKFTFRPGAGLQMDIDTHAIKFLPPDVLFQILNQMWSLEKHEAWLKSMHCNLVN